MKCLPWSFALLFLLACGDPPHPTLSISVTPTALSPGDGFTLTVTVTDFELLPPASSGRGEHRLSTTQHNEHGGGHDEKSDGDPNKGHYHIYLDTFDSDPILQAHLPSTMVTLPTSTSTGAHEILVRLNHEDHRIIVPHVTSKAEITVR